MTLALGFCIAAIVILPILLLISVSECEQCIFELRALRKRMKVANDG